MYSVDFVDDHTGFAVGDFGTILKTTNGGQTWAFCNSGTRVNLRSVDFPSPSTGFATGTDGIILKTTDAGETWNAQTSGTQRELRSVFFVTETTGYICGHHGMILKTTDGGGLSVDEPVRKNSGMTISPNPARDRISILMTARDPGEIRADLYEITGRHVLTNYFSPQQPLDIDISGLTDGLYLVKVKTSKRTEVGKVIIKL